MTSSRTRSPGRPKPKRAGGQKARTDAGTGKVRSQLRGHAPPQLLAATVCAFALAVGLLAWDLTDEWRNAPPSAVGQIALPAAGGISLVDSASGRATELIPSSANASVTAVAWSPDRSTVAYTLFHRRQGDRVSSAELFTIPASGGTPTLVVPRPQPGTVIDAPVWSPDGAAMYYAFQGVEDGKPVARVERVELGSGESQRLYDNAAFPSASPDGKLVAFSYDDGRGQALHVGPATGGQARELVKATAFRGLMGPRFSPDGAWIAFVAVGPGPAGDVRQRPTGLAAIFSVPVAEAHGDPWGVWKIRPDGSDLQLATTLQEDDPLISWSRDGAWIAVHGTGGLWIVDARGTGEPRRIADGTIGGIDW